MKLVEAVSKRTLFLLEAKQYTRYKLCKEGGLSESSLAHLINTTINDVKLSTVFAIADSLGVSLKDFFDDPVFDEVED